MTAAVSAATLEDLGLPPERARAVADAAAALDAELSPADRWAALARRVLRPDDAFAAHRHLFDAVFAGWDPADKGPPPAWTPDPARARTSNVGRLAAELGLATYPDLHAWSVRERAAFWERVLERLGVVLRRPWERVLDASGGAEHPRWLTGARLNVAESCFTAPAERPAIVEQAEGRPLRTWSHGELEALTARVAAGLAARGLVPGDAVAVALPMTGVSVAAYLGIVRAGCVVVGIADSFSAPEVAARLRIGEAKAVVTQDVVRRGGKSHPLHAKVVAAGGPPALVVTAGRALDPLARLRPEDTLWDDFLGGAPAALDWVERDPDDPSNVLFSSGTTGDPKAIPWTHTTPLKCAADGHLHHDLGPGDVVAWPTNLGWMMGPWLIYAGLVNGATLALFDGAPTGRAFGAFVAEAGVTMLGVVPSLVRTWRETGCLEGLDWSGVRRFSSTGECSHADDVLWLMSRAGYAPVIEYCGGTEVGGGYVTGTLVQPASPGTFTTPALGLDFELRDDAGHLVSDGEVFLVPPSIGLSQSLLNADHHAIYYEGVPAGGEGRTLRRHGDHLEALPWGYYRAHGRTDDAMNLGGIKVSAAAIEALANACAGVHQTAAVACAEAAGGPSRLVVYAEPAPGASLDPAALRDEVQARIRAELNPLFKVHEAVVLERLPRTASNKVLRRELRARYQRDRGGPRS